MTPMAVICPVGNLVPTVDCSRTGGAYRETFLVRHYWHVVVAPRIGTDIYLPKPTELAF